MNPYEVVNSRWPRRESFRSTQAWSECLESFLRGLPPLIIPNYQRGQVWTDAQKLAFVDNLLVGVSPAPVVIWQLEYTKRMILLDGYQRLSTLGVPLVDEAGQPIETRPVLVDVTKADLTMEPGPGRYSIVQLIAQPWDRADPHISNHAYMLRGQCVVKAGDARLLSITIRCQDPADALEQFRWLNSGGTPMDPAHLARIGGEQ